VRLLDRDAPDSTLAPRVRGGDPWDGAQGSRLLCARCGHPISAASWARTVGDGHEHSFVNPHGYLFRIGCFERAPGCALEGAEHAEYSWFEGTTWQRAPCGRCRHHLGWAFRGAQDRFFGLILDRLVPERGGPPAEG
jgi:hypothetical protein